MGKPGLRSLEIQRFRGFQHLQIKQLGRVNLIVGKNNIGKSSLLDALQIYACRGNPLLIWQLLNDHDEDIKVSRRDYEESLSVLKYLFYGRREIKTNNEPFLIGSDNKPDQTLSCSINYFRPKIEEDGTRIIQPVLFESAGAESESAEDLIPRFHIQFGKQLSFNAPIEPSASYRMLRSEGKDINCVFTRSNGLSKRRVAELWDQISLTDKEKEVLAILRIIAPGLEAIRIVGESRSGRDRFAIVKVNGIREPIPIRSLGDGMQRMLGISLALVNAENGLLLIDEIENGLHYSVQFDLWHLIFQVARRLNVQVFATTHSWDCVEAFQKASQEEQQEEGFLIRLEHKNGEVSATVFNEQQLGIATREQIEVR